jgi:hypothetical protein
MARAADPQHLANGSFLVIIDGYTLTDTVRAGTISRLHRGYRNGDRAPVLIKRLMHELPTPGDIVRLRHEHLITHELAALT